MVLPRRNRSFIFSLRVANNHDYSQSMPKFFYVVSSTTQLLHHVLDVVCCSSG